MLRPNLWPCRNYCSWEPTDRSRRNSCFEKGEVAIWRSIIFRFSPLLWLTLGLVILPDFGFAEDVLKIEQEHVQVGIDRNRGGAITWISWPNYPKNAVNISDPGRLIQQSYYAGKSLDRRHEGQSKSWSPWTWNPIQGGGVGKHSAQRGNEVGSWARVLRFEKEASTLFSETVPKLWDMENEEAQAIMRQWTSIDAADPQVIIVRCEFESRRVPNDPWGQPVVRAQEIPACYFTRNFQHAKSYLGETRWRDESASPGPPWGKADPPRKTMAFFDQEGEGIAVFSPASSGPWNFGPHGTKISNDPLAGPCMHVAPLDHIALDARSIYRYRYWLIVGNEEQIAKRIDRLWETYSTERAEHRIPNSSSP